MPNYSVIDQPLLLWFLFFPRNDVGPCPANAFDIRVPVEEDISLYCRFYGQREPLPCVLYFHGNGEVICDYDNIAPLYNMMGVNLIVTDYRGYGASGGNPTFTALINDAHALLGAVDKGLNRLGIRRDLWVMGRSMGSIPALELAAAYPQEIKGLIIESGFISATRLIRNWGLPAEGIDLDALEEECLDTVRRVQIPTLVLHGERDTLVPVKEAHYLYNNLGSERKQLVIIPEADHNDILMVGFEQYLSSIREFMEL